MTDSDDRAQSSIETRLDNYVFDRGLGDGSPLPSVSELAAAFQCNEQLVRDALESAQRKKKVTYDQGVWRLVATRVVSDASFSFTQSARGHGHPLTTDVKEAAARLPSANQGDLLYATEHRAYRALGLSLPAPFIVIERVRLFDGHPGALQRVYLNPANFSNDFLERHNFATESLIDIYRHYGYTLKSRDTVLAARLTSPYEQIEMSRYDKTFWSRVVLDAEQLLYADKTGRSSFVLEFLKASYFDGWRYEIKNRPASL